MQKARCLATGIRPVCQLPDESQLTPGTAVSPFADCASHSLFQLVLADVAVLSTSLATCWDAEVPSRELQESVERLVGGCENVFFRDLDFWCGGPV